MTDKPEKIGVYRCSYCGRYEINGYCDYCQNCYIEYATLIQEGHK